MRSCITILIFSFCLPLQQQAQRSRLVEFDYAKADSIAINYPRKRYDDAKALAKQLCMDVHTEQEKFRVIFRWITENIEYRYGRRETEADDVLKKKKAVCQGYACLLEAMCHAVDLKCQTITGFAKSNPHADIPVNMKVSNHAWNAIYLANEWHLVDATWAAGTVDPKRRKFKKEYNEQWFLVDPDFFIYSHYPDNERWFLNDVPMKKRQFKKSPILYFKAYEKGLKLKKSTKSVVGKKLKFQFTSNEPIEWMSMQLINEKEPQGVLLVNDAGFYKVDYEFQKGDKGGLYVFIDGEPALGFYKKP